MANQVREFTLIDVMRGLDKLALYKQLPGTEFHFLIGLIMRANELGFPKRLDLTNGQAMGCGGGECSESVRIRRRKLAKIRIQNQWLVKFNPGDKWKKQASTYQINYKLLVSQTQVWSNSTESWPTPCPTSVGQGVGQGVGHPKIRREERSGNTTSSGISIPGACAREEFSEKELFVIEEMSKAVGQMITPNNEFLRDAVAQFAEQPKERISAVAKRAGEQHVTSSGIVGWMRRGLNDYRSLYAKSGKRQGLSRGEIEERIGNMRLKIEDLESKLSWAKHSSAEEYDPPDGVGIPQDPEAYREWVIESLDEQLVAARRTLLRLVKERGGDESGEGQ